MQEYAKLPYILSRKTTTVSSNDTTGVEVNALYSDNVQDIAGAFTIDKDVTAGSEFTIAMPYMINALTNGNAGFTAKLAETITYEDARSTYGGNYITGLSASCEPVTMQSVTELGYPSVKLKFSSTVNHISGKIYVRSLMKAGE